MAQHQRRSTGYVPSPQGYVPPPPPQRIPNGYGQPYTGGYQQQEGYGQPHTYANEIPPYPPGYSGYGGYSGYNGPQQPAPTQASRSHYVDDRMYNGPNYREQ
jgi:hypothetical protein